MHGLCNELQEFNLIAFNNSWRECRQLPRMPVIESKAVSTKPCVSGKVQWLWIISSNGAPSWNSRAPRGSAKKFQLYSHVCKAHLHQDDTHKSSSHWTFALAFGFTWKIHMKNMWLPECWGPAVQEKSEWVFSRRFAHSQKLCHQYRSAQHQREQIFRNKIHPKQFVGPQSEEGKIEALSMAPIAHMFISLDLFHMHVNLT